MSKLEGDNSSTTKLSKIIEHEESPLPRSDGMNSDKKFLDQQIRSAADIINETIKTSKKSS